MLVACLILLKTVIAIAIVAVSEAVHVGVVLVLFNALTQLCSSSPLGGARVCELVSRMLACKLNCAVQSPDPSVWAGCCAMRVFMECGFRTIRLPVPPP